MRWAGVRTISKSTVPETAVLLILTGDIEEGFVLLFFFQHLFLFIWRHQVLAVACGIQFLNLGWNPGPLHWELRVLAPGPPAKSWGRLLKRTCKISFLISKSKTFCTLRKKHDAKNKNQYYHEPTPWDRVPSDCLLVIFVLCLGMCPASVSCASAW